MTHVNLEAIGAQKAVDAWAHQMKNAIRLPYPFTIEQIGAIATAMINSGVPHWKGYELMKALGVGPSATDDGIAPHQAKEIAVGPRIFDPIGLALDRK